MVKVYYRLQDRKYIAEYESTRSTNTTLLDLNYTKELLKELRMLSYKDTKLITQLRLGYMQIEGEDRFIEPVCNCGAPLTTQHFLIECKDNELVERRRDLKNELETMEPQYKEKLHYLMNPYASQQQKMDMMTLLLYPHLLYNYNQLNEFTNKLIRFNNLKMLLCYCRYRFPD